jgi:pantetheine-phosphate adenylyltransferase
MNKSIVAVYPGSFDPPTNGHLNIVKRILQLFPKLVVAITNNIHKTHFFSLQERVNLFEQSVLNLNNVKVQSFLGLLVNYINKLDTFVIIRGIRKSSDFEYEFQMALINRTLKQNIETVFLIPDNSYTLLSSSMVKELAIFGHNISSYVPIHVEKALKKRIYEDYSR